MPIKTREYNPKGFSGAPYLTQTKRCNDSHRMSFSLSIKLICPQLYPSIKDRHVRSLEPIVYLEMEGF